MSTFITVMSIPIYLFLFHSKILLKGFQFANTYIFHFCLQHCPLERGRPHPNLTQGQMKIQLYLYLTLQQDPLEKILICQHLLPTSVISSTSITNLDEEQQRNTNNKTKELHLQIKGKHQNDLRRQLLGFISISFYVCPENSPVNSQPVNTPW